MFFLHPVKFPSQLLDMNIAKGLMQLMKLADFNFPLPVSGTAQKCIIPFRGNIFGRRASKSEHFTEQVC